MPSTENLVNAVKTYLKSHHMLAYDSWIEGCVEYCIETNVETNVNEIEATAHEQWLLHDMKDICPGSLPPNLAAQQKSVLNGCHVLQINTALDISIPAYQQYLKMKKTDIENIKATTNPEEKNSSKRMFKLELTDGKQTISGMEYETINKFKNDIKPGSKILIKGPVQCRQGMLLLTDNSVEMLNGEVPEMAVSHSLAAQLSTKLRLPMIEDVDLSEITQSVDQTTTTTQRSASTEVAVRPTPQLHQPQRNTNTIANRSRENVSNSEDVIDIDLYELPQQNASKRQLTDHTLPQSSEKKMKVDSTSNIVSSSTDNDYPDENELAELMFEDEEYLREIETQFEEKFNESIEETTPKGPVEVEAEPFIYIKQINDLSDSEKSGKVYRVKAQILSVLTKLTMTDKWNLKCKLTDGTGCMDVEFSSDILSGFLGYTPQDINALKKNISSNPELKSQINLAYKKTTKILENLYCIIELTMYTLPRITRVIDFEHSHVDLLQKRLNASGL